MTRIPFCTLVLGAATLAASLSATASSDELYYPASNCQPFNAAGWQGGGSSGFAFQSVNGGMFNFDVDDAEALVCPVPYFRDVVALKPVTVRVVIDVGIITHHRALDQADCRHALRLD